MLHARTRETLKARMKGTQRWREAAGRMHTLVELIQISWLQAEWTLEDKIVILKRKYCWTVCAPPPFMPSLDASFARVYNATCLWLLMTTAALHSTILLTHLSTLTNHLYSEFLFACVYIHASVGVCVGLRYPNSLRVAPSCVCEPIIFTSVPNDCFGSARGGGIEIRLAAVRCAGAFCLSERPEVGDGSIMVFCSFGLQPLAFFF